MKTGPEIVVALGFDGDYAPHAAATIASIARVTQGTVSFLLLHADVDAVTKAKVEEAAPSSRFTWVAVGEEDVPAFVARSHFTRATLFRLGLEKLAPANCRRLIYLDCDVVVQHDVGELWRTDLGGLPIGAVVDESVDALDFAQRWDLRPSHRYFNAGVLLIDLEVVRKDQLFSKAIEFLADNAARLPWNDQDALNWACSGQWVELPPAWNVQRNMAIGAMIKAPRIIHFTGAQKPWLAKAYHPWSWLYWRALARTPFRGGHVGSQVRSWLRWLRRKPRARTERLWLGPASLDISLVISTRNRAPQLARCLDAIANIQFDGAWELIVVDNGSSDSTASVIEAARERVPAPVRMVYEAQPGSGRARNKGIAIARGRVIAFTDDDCYVAPDYLTRAVQILNDSELGFITGRVNLHDASDAPVTINTSTTARRIPANSFIHTDGVIGANLVLRREALEKIGGFAEDLGAGTPFAAEDVDLAARVSHAGWDGAYDPMLIVAHHHGRKAADVAELFRFYDIGRGAYTIRYLLRGQILAFLKGVASLRFRMGPPSKWRLATFSMPWWEAYGAVAYVLARAKFAGQRLFRGA